MYKYMTSNNNLNPSFLAVYKCNAVIGEGLVWYRAGGEEEGGITKPRPTLPLGRKERVEERVELKQTKQPPYYDKIHRLS